MDTVDTADLYNRLAKRITQLGVEVKRLDRRCDYQAGTITDLSDRLDDLVESFERMAARLDALEAARVAAEPVDSNTTPASVAAWREWVVLPCDVSEPRAVAVLLRWLSMLGAEEDQVERRVLLGWLVALAEQESGEPADPDAVVEDGVWRVESVLYDLMLHDSVHWCWVADYCAAWLMHLCTEEAS